MKKKKQIPSSPVPLVSVLVSTYRAEEFLVGCLEDLTQQSLYQKGMVEVIVIDAFSPEDEVSVVYSFQEQFPDILYLRLPERETLYSAWNHGIRLARGKFLTNANTDDRHHPKALEKLADALKRHPKIDLVYADVYENSVPGQPFKETSGEVRYRYRKYSAPRALLHYQFGCQPMWRRELHESIGAFPAAMKAAGDYAFNLKFALAAHRAKHIDEVLGSFLVRDDSLSTDDDTSGREQRELRQRYFNPETVLSLFAADGRNASSPKQEARLFRELGNEALSFPLPWHPGQMFTDPELALLCFTEALKRDPNDLKTVRSLASLLQTLGRPEDAQALVESLNA